MMMIQQQQKQASVVALVAMTMMIIVSMMSIVDSFSTTSTTMISTRTQHSMELQMGMFDNWRAGGTAGGDELNDEYAKQQRILEERRAPKSQRDKYFQKVEQRRQTADKERSDNWAWQTKTYKKGEDPIDEWKKRRADGTIGDLEDQYGDPKKIGGIPLPMASFGVGGEFGLGGKVSLSVYLCTCVCVCGLFGLIDCAFNLVYVLLCPVQFSMFGLYMGDSLIRNNREVIVRGKNE